MRTINPATEELLEDHPEDSPQQVRAKLDRAAETFRAWRTTSFEHRAALMRQAAKALRRRQGELSVLMAGEMGKPVAAGEAEVSKCAAACDFFADRAAALLARDDRPSDATRSYVRCDPLGPVLAIMPWNFPLWQVFRFAAPALMAGNVGLLKHAENVPGCALAIEGIFREAGFPAGAFTTLLIDKSRAEAVIRDPVVRAVTLTGSDRAGRAVASQAGDVLKKTVLELGGSDPFIVLPDVDIDAVAQAAAEARCINSGQSCIAAKRFIVAREIFERFEQAFAEKLAALKVGDPMDRATQVGPLARADLRDHLADQVDRSIASGARLVLGGRVPASTRGYFYPPTLLSGVRPGMPAFDEETFGPVAALIRADDPDGAIRLANHSRFGLGASIWTRDLSLAERMAGDIEAGCVFINGPVKSDPRLPFGGIKESGFGRELSAEGIREFVNLKTVWVKEGERAE